MMTAESPEDCRKKNHPATPIHWFLFIITMFIAVTMIRSTEDKNQVLLELGDIIGLSILGFTGVAALLEWIWGDPEMGEAKKLFLMSSVIPVILFLAGRWLIL